ncbi:hypothetical protein dsx2_3120 [Desulfovibrio sp. X2]|uniref:hypothetical protein n=1 Tax=Desulfovibrio sp. X2 TaxID=941449 RepID=UPI0003587576|nr:hypothetical protein [Desulfovibrio sp. X2]EPR41601.1 hypothetical protein dsx2_3120 [Desulfovibrio sp. X2]
MRDMPTGVFVLVVAAIGVLLLLLLTRMRRRWNRRGRRGPDPLLFWMKGKLDDEDDEDR